MSRIGDQLLPSGSARNAKPNLKRRPFKRSIKDALDPATMRAFGKLLDTLPKGESA